jgi:hypothetical protein
MVPAVGYALLRILANAMARWIRVVVAVFELCVVAVWCQRSGMHDYFSKSGAMAR